MAYGLWLGVGIGGVVIVVVVVLLWAISHRLNRKTGNTGFAKRSRLTCPKCGQTFDYEWVPGAALTAVRLGSSRYMACPLCHKRSTFNIYDTLVPGSAPTDAPPAQ